MFHYLIVVNYADQQFPPSYTAVMSPFYTEKDLSIKDTKTIYNILKGKIEKFVKEEDYRDKKLYKEIRIFKIEEFKKEDILEEIFIDPDDIDAETKDITLKGVNYQYFELLMAFKDYDAFVEFGKTL